MSQRIANETIDTGLGNFGTVERDDDDVDTSDLDDVDTSDLDSTGADAPPPPINDPNAGSAPPAAKPEETAAAAPAAPPAETPEATIQRLQATIDHLNGTMGHLIKGSPPAAANNGAAPAGTNGTAPGTPPATPPGGLAPERMKDYEGVRDILDYHTEPHFNELRASHGTLVNVQDQFAYVLNAVIDVLASKGIDVPALNELGAVEGLQQQIYKTRGVWLSRGEVAMMHRGMKAPAATAVVAKAAAETGAANARKQAAHNAAHATDGGNAFTPPRTNRKPQSRAERIKMYEQDNGGRRL